MKRGYMRWRILIGIIVVLGALRGGVLPGYGEKTKTICTGEGPRYSLPEDPFRKALDLFHNGKEADATTLLKEQLNSHENKQSCEARWMLYYLWQFHHEDNRSEFKDFVESFYPKTYPEYHLGLAMFYCSTERVDLAFNEIKSMGKLEGAVANAVAAIIYNAVEESLKAVKYGKDAVKAAPRIGESYAFLGQAYFESENPDMEKAKSNFLRAAEMEPYQPWHYRWLAEIMASQKKFDKAHEYMEKARKLWPLTPTDVYWKIAMEEGKFEEALEFAKSDNNKHRPCMASKMKAESYFALNKIEEAQSELQSILSNPLCGPLSKASANIDMAGIYIGKESYEDALNNLKEAESNLGGLKIRSALAEIALTRCDILNRQQLFTSARVQCEKAKRYNHPRPYEVEYLIAISYFGEKDCSSARSHMRKAIELAKEKKAPKEVLDHFTSEAKSLDEACGY